MTSLKSVKCSLWVLLSLLFVSPAQAVERYLPGIHYQIVANPTSQDAQVSPPPKPQLLEFFSLGCPHCEHLEPLLQKWLAKNSNRVDFKRMPVSWSNRFRTLARLYYALDAMPGDKQYAGAVFTYIHQQKKPLWKESQIMTFVDSVLKLDVKRFQKLWDSAEVKQSVQHAAQLTANYQVTGVPAFVVKERYLVTVNQAGSFENMFAITEFLINK